MTIDEAPRADRMKWIELGAALLATALVLVDYAVFLAHAGALWRDEINSVNLASMPSVGDTLRLAEFDSFPVFWTLLLRGWIAIAGHGDGALRVAGVIGALSVVAALWIAARVTGRGAPLVSLAIVAAHPGVLRWSATVRAFGPGACAAVLAMVTMIRVVESPTRARVALAIAATVCSVHLLFQNAVFVAVAVAGAILAALATGHARRAWIPVAIGAAGAASLLPYVGLLGRVGTWSPLLTADVTLSDIVSKLVDVARDTNPVSLAVWGVFLAAALTGGIRMLVRGDPERRGLAVACAAMAIGAPVAFTLFLVRLRYRTESWYYVGLIVFVAVCVEIAMRMSLRGTAMRGLTVALSIAAIAAGSARVWGSMHQRQTIVDQVASRLEESVRPGDVVLLFPWFYALPIDRYYHGPAEVLTIPPLADRRLHRYDLLKAHMLEDRVMDPVLERMRTTLQAGHRLWIVGTLNGSRPGVPRRPLPPPPRPKTGWSVEPDLGEWSIDAGDFLRAHAGTMRRISRPKEGDPPEESPALSMVEGWRP